MPQILSSNDVAHVQVPKKWSKSREFYFFVVDFPYLYDFGFSGCCYWAMGA